MLGILDTRTVCRISTQLKKPATFLIASILLWFPVAAGLGFAAEGVGLPDTEAWLWILRAVSALVVLCIGWVIVGATRAKEISQATFGVIGIISNFLLVGCIILGAFAVVMIFVRDAKWLYEHMYRPFLLRASTVAVISLLPLALLLILFRNTRFLGGIGLYLLTFFFGFTLWFYSLMVSGSHGPGWLIGGLLVMGFGVILTAVISSAVWGQWAVAGIILISAILIFCARTLGWIVAEKQFERETKQRAMDDPDPETAATSLLD